MLGPSSSHVAGAVKLGMLARAIFGEKPQSVDIHLHGSFRKTGKGHGAYEALVAGLLLPNCTVADPRIPDAISLVRQEGIEPRFHTDKDLGRRYHPNTVKFVLENEGKRRQIVGSSIGGGRAVIIEIDDFNDLSDMEIKGEADSLVVFCDDREGRIREVLEAITAQGNNVGSLHFQRQRVGGKALLTLTTDKPVDQPTLIRLRQRIKNIREVAVIKPLVR